MNQATKPKKILQIQGSVKTLLSPNDKLSQKLFQRPPEKFERMVTKGTPATIDEKIPGKKKITSQYWIEFLGDFCDMTPLDAFDRAVADICISAQSAGMTAITIAEISRVMAGGKRVDTKLYPSRKEKILRSVNRLRFTNVTVDFAKLAATGKYPKLPTSGRLSSTILPCDIGADVTVNGQRAVDVVIFRGESLLLTLARAKNRQLLSYPIGLLDVPNQNNTELVTATKFYVVRWVHAVKTHKELKPIILFETLYQNCRLSDGDKDKKFKARKIARDTLENLKIHGVISAFEFEKVDGVYRAIKFQY